MKRLTALTRNPLYITVAGLVCLAGFVLWLLSVVVPITLIELRYQFQHAFVKDLIVPKFTTNTHPNGIVIPAVFIDEPIVFNVDPNDSVRYLEALKHGIAHASGTGFPGSGTMGYYFAHSSTPTFVRQFNAVFYLLHKLNIGDAIHIFQEGKRYDYVVYAKQLVDPKDTSFLRYTNPVETIVLQTCWPPGTTSERLLVFAKRIQHE